jgi:hypothetical protein
MRSLLVAFFALAIGCERQEPPFELAVRVVDADGAAVANVPILVGQTLLGRTDRTGTLDRMLSLKEGTTLALTLSAPAAYKPVDPVPVVLRRIQGLGGAGSLPIEQVVRLEPRETSHAVLVRAGVAGLPVLAFGEQRAVTDEHGAAMFLYRGEPGAEVPVRIDTSQRKDLQPQSPSTSFVLSSHSEAHLIDQHFRVLAPPAPAHHHRSRPHRPKKL